MIDSFLICDWMYFKGLSMRDIIVLAIIFRYSQSIQTFDPFNCLDEIADELLFKAEDNRRAPQQESNSKMAIL